MLLSVLILNLSDVWSIEKFDTFNLKKATNCFNDFNDLEINKKKEAPSAPPSFTQSIISLDELDILIWCKFILTSILVWYYILVPFREKPYIF